MISNENRSFINLNNIRGKTNDELILFLSSLDYTIIESEKYHNSNIISHKSVVTTVDNIEIHINFCSNFTNKEINNSAGADNYTYITLYLKRDGDLYAYRELFKKNTKSLRNIRKNYETGYELFNKITNINKEKNDEE